MTKKTYYDILDVHISATANEIKDSYRLHASAWHPDKHVGSNKKRAEERMTLLNEAYSILGDPKKRADYNRKLNQQDSKETEAKAAHSAKDTSTDVREAPQHENVKRQAQESSQTAEDIRRTREYIDITRQNPEEYKRAMSEEIERRAKAGRPRHDQFDVFERQRIIERIKVLLREKTERDTQPHKPNTPQVNRYSKYAREMTPFLIGATVGAVIGAYLDAWCSYGINSPGATFVEKLPFQAVFIIFNIATWFMAWKMAEGLGLWSLFSTWFLILVFCWWHDIYHQSGPVKSTISMAGLSCVGGAFLGMAAVLYIGRALYSTPAPPR